MDEFRWDEGEPGPLPSTRHSGRISVGEAERRLANCGFERLQCGQPGWAVFVHADTRRPNKHLQFADPDGQTFRWSDVERLLQAAEAEGAAAISELLIKLRDAIHPDRKP